MSEDSGIRELAGRYRLITPLGRRVMRGWDLHLRQVVAIRLIDLQDDEQDLFVERAGALTELSHPGLVRVLDAGVADGEPFVVQEFIAGATLRARLGDGPMEAAEVTELGSALGKALAYAHSQGVAHRDVQPGNILLGPSMEPYLTNIGIADTTTVSYMAPEQADGAEPTMASDVYSFGLVLLEALTGRVEYPGDDATTALARLSRAPIIGADLPHAATLRMMLSASPNDRPDAATCVDMLRGSSAKSRVQTRTVLIAAVAAAVAAMGVAIVVNLPQDKPQPLVEPRVVPRVVPQQETVTERVTATPTAPYTPPTITEVAGQTTTGQSTQTPVQTPTGTPPPPTEQVIHDQPVLLIPIPPTVPERTTPWYPWYPQHADWPKRPRKPQKDDAPGMKPSSPPGADKEEGKDEDD